LGYILLRFLKAAYRLAHLDANMGFAIPHSGYVDWPRSCPGSHIPYDDYPCVGYFKISRQNSGFRITAISWATLIAGAMVVFLSFITDYTRFILHSFTLRELWSLPSKQALFDLSVQYIPFSFPWMIFAAGSAVIIAAGIRIFNENR